MTDQHLFVFIILTVSIMVFLALATLLIFNVSQRRILSEVSQRQASEIEFRKQVVESIIETQEKERSRIARELHDDIGSKLNVINLNINLIREAVSSGDNTSDLFENLQNMLGESIERTRVLSHELLPPVLDKFGLQSAILSLAKQINLSGSLTIKLDINQEWGRLEKIKELHIYRIIQEMVNNTIRHASARNITISSRVKDALLIIQYQDDGKGIADVEAASQGMGIQNILSRIKLLGAEHAFDDRKDATGFSIRINIPLIEN